MSESMCRILMSVLMVLLCAGAAGAQGEFFLYQSGCQVDVSGSLNVTASVTGAASGSSTDSDTFVTTHAIPSTTSLTFSDQGDANASISLSFQDSCTTQGFSQVSGNTSYDFIGDLSQMVFNAASVRNHTDRVSRDVPSTGPGGPASADSEYLVSQLDAIEIFVPFQVAGANNGKITVTDFDLKRSDTGPTTGNMVAVWQVFTDINGNCQIDAPQDQSVGGDAGIVFPNGSYSGPSPTFATPRGNYVLWLTYFAVSDETAATADCSQSARASSEVRDEAYIRLQLN